MAFCGHCGHQLADNSKFCNECGKPLGDNNSATEQRKTSYQGTLHKCPNCGELLESFVAICPACNYELRGTASTSTISEFAANLSRAKSETERINMVRTFPVPNTKEDIFEFMLLAIANFDAVYYVNHMDIEDVSDAWLSKINQCYQKAELVLAQSDFTRIEEMHRSINKKIAQAQSDLEDVHSATAFNKSSLRIVLIASACTSAFLTLIAFLNKRVISGIIGILMIALFSVAFLMGSNIIKEKKKHIRWIPTILAFVLIVPYFLLFLHSANSPYNSKLNSIHSISNIETIEWAELVLGNELPDFGKTQAEVVHDNDKHLILYFYNQTKDEFKDYINTCKSFGYDIDAEDDGANFTAYNSDGYYLHLQWLDLGDKKLTIDLEAPKKRERIVWPNSNLVKNVPVPKSLIGEVSSESSDAFSVYLVDIDKSYFSEYVSLCIENGFNVDYSKSETYFHGENEDGVSLTVEYEGFNTLYIYISDWNFD